MNVLILRDKVLLSNTIKVVCGIHITQIEPYSMNKVYCMQHSVQNSITGKASGLHHRNDVVCLVPVKL